MRDQVAPRPVIIQSWLYLVPSENVLSGTVWDCFKISGAINDEGGGPTWTDDGSYNAPNQMATGGVAAASKECAAREPAGGAILVPPPEPGQYGFAAYPATPGATAETGTGLSSLYAVHTLIGRKGDITIDFAATDNMTSQPLTVKLPDGSTVEVQPVTTGPACTWLITGGTGAYAGIEGSGTCFANGENTVPYFNHTEHGAVWWEGPSVRYCATSCSPRRMAAAEEETSRNLTI